MRRVVDIAAVIVAGVLIGLIAIYRNDERVQDDRVKETMSGLREFRQVIGLKSATKDVELNGRGWPSTIDPTWFRGEPPQNPLLSASRPWVEVATAEQADELHPEVRIAVHEGLASFWYNPYQGIVRARVPVTISDKEALDLYNRVNEVKLRSIFAEAPPPAPEPKAEAEPGMSEQEMDPTKPDPERVAEHAG
jgi:hypothetical protein